MEKPQLGHIRTKAFSLRGPRLLVDHSCSLGPLARHLLHILETGEATVHWSVIIESMHPEVAYRAKL